MDLKIRRAAVLGAGVMGAQIAALLSAAGVRVYLLDLSSNEPPKDPAQAKAVGKNFRSARAILAVENLRKLKPSPLYLEQHLDGIIPGNFDDDFSNLAEVDWVIEAVAEKIDIKKSIHKRIAETVRPGVPVTTNTSGIPLASICEDMPEHYEATFFGTHFFNPPRYMKLLEIIPAPGTDLKLMQTLSTWIEERLGKGIVVAKDTVNFIANRIGVFVNQATLAAMDDLKLNIETVDALTGKIMGRPPSASFRTMDVVGLDTFAHVAQNTYDKAPNDPYRKYFVMPNWMTNLIQTGRLGQKSNSVGCYKKDKDAKGKTVILAYRPASDTYVEQEVQEFSWMAEAEKTPDTFARLKKILQQNDAGATLVWRALRDTFAYSAHLVGDIADGLVKPVDDAIRWGFNWQWGPFELWQGLGFDDVLTRMQKDGVKLPAWVKSGVKFYDPSPTDASYELTGAQKQFNAVKGKAQDIPTASYDVRLPTRQNTADPRVVESCEYASLVDLKDDVYGLVFHSKMNSLNQAIIEFTQKAVDKTLRSASALVIANQGGNFSAGANLKEVLTLIDKKDFTTLDKFIRAFQGTMQLLKFAPFPVISCPYGLVLGGGCEVSLHTSARVAYSETYAGLVEIGVGVLPAGGGTKELALRAYRHMSITERGDPMPFLQRAFLLIGMARTSTSAHEAIQMGLYPQGSTHVTLSKEHQIVHAKRLAHEMLSRGYIPPTPEKKIQVVGDPGVQTFKLMLYNMIEQRQVSPYDAFIAERIATVLCGGQVDGGSFVSEQYLLDLERQGFVELCQQTKTRERIEHMLKTGGPLRN